MPEQLNDIDILRTLRDSSQPILSAQDLADKLGFSRQHLDQRLRRLHDRDRVERIEVGPGVGWYIEKPAIEVLGDEITDYRLISAHVAPCRVCDERLGDGDRAIAMFEQLESDTTWEGVDAICPHHADDENELRDLFGGLDEYVDAGLRRHGMVFAFVEGELVERDDSRLGHLTVRDVSVRELLGNEARTKYLD